MIKEDNNVKYFEYIFISNDFIECKILCNLSKTNLLTILLFQRFRLLYEISHIMFRVVKVCIRFFIKIDAISTYQRNFNNKNDGTLKFYVLSLN